MRVRATMSGSDCLVVRHQLTSLRKTGGPIPAGRKTMDIMGFRPSSSTVARQGLDVLDGVYNDFRDGNRVHRECEGGA